MISEQWNRWPKEFAQSLSLQLFKIDWTWFWAAYSPWFSLIRLVNIQRGLLTSSTLWFCKIDLSENSNSQGSLSCCDTDILALKKKYHTSCSSHIELNDPTKWTDIASLWFAFLGLHDKDSTCIHRVYIYASKSVVWFTATEANWNELIGVHTVQLSSLPSRMAPINSHTGVLGPYLLLHHTQAFSWMGLVMYWDHFSYSAV